MRKEYKIHEFYQSRHARVHEIDWLRLVRQDDEGTAFFIDVSPSEITKGGK